jgi:hypothetical protein
LEHRPESREKLVATGLRAASGIGAGAALLLLRGLTGFGALSLPGVIVGGALSLFGLGTAGSSKERADRLGGTATAALGIVTVAASVPVVGAPVNALMWLGGLAFIGYGIATFARFLKGLRSRK